MKSLVIIGILLIIAAVTNPSREAHIAEINRKIVSKPMDSAIDGIKGSSNLELAGTAIGFALGMKAIDAILETVVSVDNLVLVSLTRVTYQGNSRIIGFGAFGNVWIT